MCELKSDSFLHLLHISINIKEHGLTIWIELPAIGYEIVVFLKISLGHALFLPRCLLKHLHLRLLLVCVLENNVKSLKYYLVF